jgi:uracil-DNA glycosylase family 4
MAVGEAPGAHEEAEGIPFVGAAGAEFDQELADAGLLERLVGEEAPTADYLRKQRGRKVFLTNVCKYRPPENKIEAFFLDSKCTKPNELIKEGIQELKDEISRVRPKLILALGNTALWALTGHRGITKWRGSMLRYGNALLLPTYHPALILREWSWRPIAVHDLRKALDALRSGGWPEKKKLFIVRPSFPDAMDLLGSLLTQANTHASPDHPLPLASDLETRSGHISCSGIAWSDREAICLPYMSIERPQGYWTAEQEVALWERERSLLTHPHVEVSGQNYLYDAQYKARRQGYLPRLRHDTMFMQNVAFAGLPKGLDFLSSMYRSHHVYWKDEGKLWNPKTMPEERHWLYNCEDAIATFEVRDVLEGVLRKRNLWEQYQFQMRLWWVLLRMSLRGLKIDLMLRNSIASELLEAIGSRQQELNAILGYEINLDSNKQVHDLFYNQLRCQVVRNRKTKQPTCDQDALVVFGQREPLLRCITERVADIRGLSDMMSNVIKAALEGGRIRSSFSVAETYRLTSSKDAFGGGTNLQNWTKGDEETEEERKERLLRAA